MKTRIIQDDPEEPAPAPRRSTPVASQSAPTTWRPGWAAGAPPTEDRDLRLARVRRRAFVIGNIVGTKQLDPNKTRLGRVRPRRRDARRPSSSSRRASTCSIQSTTLTVDDPAFRAAVADVVRTLGSWRRCRTSSSPFAAGNADQISNDRHTALVPFELRTTDLDEGKDARRARRDGVVAAAARASRDRDRGVRRHVERQLDDAISEDFAKAGLFSMPVTLVDPARRVRRARRRRPAAAARAHRRLATIGLLALPSQLMPLDQDVSVIVLLIGLAVGVDYSMFYLQARARGAGRRTQRARRARGRRGDLGPRRARLRPDRDDRDGRHVLHRRQDVRGLRRRAR